MIYAVLDDPETRRAPVRALLGDALREGGPPVAVERFWRFVAGDDGWNGLAPELRERVRATAGTWFDTELGTYEQYLPDEQTLATIGARVGLLVSADSLPIFAEIARRLGQRIGVDVPTTPGSHAAYFDHPRELADCVRPLLRAFGTTDA